MSDDYTVGLSPWINEYTDKETPASAVKVKSPSKPKKLSRKEGADIFRKCQEEVFKRLATTPDRLGRSQQWKLNAIKSDLAAGVDNDFTDWFAKEVSKLAERYF